MTEYYTVKCIDNSRLSRAASPARARDFWRRVAAAAAVSACLLFYAWQHFECIQIRYQVEQLETQRAQAMEENQKLQLTAEALSSRKRVDLIARNELGLTVSAPALNAPLELAGEPVLAQAPVTVASARP
jgi:cell division protein FtsL